MFLAASRVLLLTGLLAFMGLVWELDADQQQVITGGKPVCNGRIWQDGISCAGDAPQCESITGAFVYQPMFYANNTFNDNDVYCSNESFKNSQTGEVISCYGGHNGWVEEHDKNCIHDVLWDGL